MKHITMADKSLLIGDEAATVLVKYAALVAQIAGGDSIELNAIGVDGQTVVANFVLNSGTVLMTESTASELPEPDNAEVTAYMQKLLRAYGEANADDATTSHPYGSEG